MRCAEIGVLVLVTLAQLVTAQQPGPPDEGRKAETASSVLSPRVDSVAEGTAAAPDGAARKPFRLDISLTVQAQAPPPEAAEALRGRLQLMSALRRGWYTGPTMQGPIFQYWSAADYSPAADHTYYAVPYYMRSCANYYFGPPAGVAQDFSLEKAIGAALVQALLVSSQH